MQRQVRGGASLAVFFALLSCASGGGWNNDDALRAEKVEVQMDARGAFLEVEYHIKPEAVPPLILSAMDARHPGGRTVAAEREISGGKLYYEVVKEINGRQVEAMFLPDGTLHEEEIQIPVASVPANVQQSIRTRYAGAPVTSWEVIRNPAKQTLAYHVKLVKDGQHLKVLFSPQGEITGVYREIPAEMEVPVR